jgi:hypothetical protein
MGGKRGILPATGHENYPKITTIKNNFPHRGERRGNFYPSLVETWDPPMEVTVPVHYPGKSIEKIPAF